MSTGYQRILVDKGPKPFGRRLRWEDEAEASPSDSAAITAAERGASHPPSILSPGLRIRLFNVKYSPNLGDGLLSECLEHALVELGANRDSWSIDLAGRKAYGDGIAGRSHLLSALDAMPDVIRPHVIKIPLAMQARRKWRPHYAERLAGANAAVIGGGNLISDLDLNFPTKLKLAVEEIERIGVPFVIYGSGVTGHWTRRGAEMLRDTFSSRLMRGVYVRDLASKHLWDGQLGQSSGHEAVVVPDPGLLASRFIPAARRHDAGPKVAGVGIMSHIAIRYHCDIAPDQKALEDWYVGLVAALSARGFHVVVFTNGSPEDVSYLARIRPRLDAIGGNISFPVARKPEQLCGIISSLNVLVAYRMHAVIASYSYKVPSVGLVWDPKLKSFMSSVGREDYLCDVRMTNPSRAADLASRAMANGIDGKAHAAVLDNAWQGISRMLQRLEGEP
jgi:polysaccharide pyruvyl transferase WcaK-like protein